MGEYNIAWDELKDALQNETACERFERGYRSERKGKEQTGIVKACSDLKEVIKKGVYYGTISNVCTL